MQKLFQKMDTRIFKRRTNYVEKENLIQHTYSRRRMLSLEAYGKDFLVNCQMLSWLEITLEPWSRVFQYISKCWSFQKQALQSDDHHWNLTLTPETTMDPAELSILCAHNLCSLQQAELMGTFHEAVHQGSVRQVSSREIRNCWHKARWPWSQQRTAQEIILQWSLPTTALGLQARCAPQARVQCAPSLLTSLRQSVLQDKTSTAETAWRRGWRKSSTSRPRQYGTSAPCAHGSRQRGSSGALGAWRRRGFSRAAARHMVTTKLGRYVYFDIFLQNLTCGSRKWTEKSTCDTVKTHCRKSTFWTTYGCRKSENGKKIPQTEIQRHNKNDKIMKFIFDFQGRLPQVEFLNKNPKQKTQKKKKHNNEIDKKMTGGCRMLIFWQTGW